MNLIETVIQNMIAQGALDREDALVTLRDEIVKAGTSWEIAKRYGVLDHNNSGESFALEFMFTFNREIWWLPEF